PRLTPSQKVSDSNGILNRPTGGIHLADAKTPNIVAEALITSDVPGGIAVTASCDGDFQSRFLHPTDTTLRGVLDAIQSVEPEYSWSVDKGVVNFGPGDDEPPFLRSMVSSLEVRNVDLNEALYQLLAIPEVAKVMKAQLGTRMVSGGPYPFSTNGGI